ncbi:hypothetical protein B0J14DRAFT_562028 [Halenospora varia]|nr:hypothetical protein B0J14DRAFT_562028 [Halenospora varia]
MGILLSDPNGPAWRDGDLDEKLQSRLGSSYPFYKGIVRRMVDALNDLQALLGFKKGLIETIALWDRDPYRWELEPELRRLRISFSKNKFDQVDTLPKRNDDLAKLLKTNDELAPLRKRRQTGPNAPLLRKIQDHACHLHTALEDAWGCNCPLAHTDPSRPKVQNPFNQFKADVDVRIYQTTISKSSIGSAIVQATTVSSSYAIENAFKATKSDKVPPRPRRHKGKRVEFAPEAPTFHEQPTTLSAPGLDQVHQSRQIPDLCTALKSIHNTNSCMGFLRDGQNRKHVIYPLYRQPSTARQSESVTLRSILAQPSGTQSAQKDRWTKNDIPFCLDGLQPRIDIQPLLSAEFYSKIVIPRPTQPTARIFNTKTALSSLGIMLLELCFGKPIEGHPLRAEYFGPDNQPNAFTDISTASKWHEDVLGELGDDAIRRCLDCSFAPKPNLGDNEFQEAVFNGAVLPLQDLLKVWEGLDSQTERKDV